MSIGIIYCETLKTEILALTAGIKEISHLEAVPWALHIEPDLLLAEMHKQIVQLQDKVDVIVLGYGRCQTMDRLEDIYKVPILRPEAEDCIGILLGQKRYDEELRTIPGTWFLSPGWTKMGTDFVFDELQIRQLLDKKADRKKIDPLKLARRMLKGFTRALYIDMQTGDDEHVLQEKAQQIADDLTLQLEKTTGSYTMLENVLNDALEITRQNADKA